MRESEWDTGLPKGHIRLPKGVKCWVCCTRWPKGKGKVAHPHRQQVRHRQPHEGDRRYCNPKGKHLDLWDAIWNLRERIEAVTWVKAHLTWEEAESKGIKRGNTGTSTEGRTSKRAKESTNTLKTQVTGPIGDTSWIRSDGGSKPWSESTPKSENWEYKGPVHRADDQKQGKWAGQAPKTPEDRQ